MYAEAYLYQRGSAGASGHGLSAEKAESTAAHANRSAAVLDVDGFQQLVVII